MNVDEIIIKNKLLEEELQKIVDRIKPNLQCIAAQDAWYSNSLPYGALQKPELWDYADGVDTLKFLENL